MSVNHNRHLRVAAVAGSSLSSPGVARHLVGSSLDSAAGQPARSVPGRTNVVRLHPGTASDRPRGFRRGKASEAGMATAEYAIATLAAVGFAGLLVFILRSEEVRGFLLNLIRTALALP